MTHVTLERIVIGSIVCAACLLVAVAIPYLFIDEISADVEASDEAAARFALGQIETSGGAVERTIRLRSRVVNVEPDPSACVWAYPGRISVIVTVKTHTLLGLPLGTWIVDCHGPRKL